MKPIIALDADGVLLNYHHAYARAWAKAFGALPALRELRPIAFVDDFLPYLRGIPSEIHAALVLREPNGSPNTGGDFAWAHSRHADLASFAVWWLNR